MTDGICEGSEGRNLWLSCTRSPLPSALAHGWEAPQASSDSRLLKGAPGRPERAARAQGGCPLQISHSFLAGFRFDFLIDQRPGGSLQGQQGPVGTGHQD